MLMLMLMMCQFLLAKLPIMPGSLIKDTNYDTWADQLVPWVCDEGFSLSVCLLLNIF